MVSEINIEQLDINTEFRETINSEVRQWNDNIDIYRRYDNKSEEIFEFAHELFVEYIQLLSNTHDFSIIDENAITNQNRGKYQINLNNSISLANRIGQFFLNFGRIFKNLSVSLWRRLLNILHKIERWILNNIQRFWNIFQQIGLSSIQIKIGIPISITLTFKNPSRSNSAPTP